MYNRSSYIYILLHFYSARRSISGGMGIMDDTIVELLSDRHHY